MAFLLLFLVFSLFGEWRLATRGGAPAWRQTQAVYRRGSVRLLLLLRRRGRRVLSVRVIRQPEDNVLRTDQLFVVNEAGRKKNKGLYLSCSSWSSSSFSSSSNLAHNSPSIRVPVLVPLPPVSSSFSSSSSFRSNAASILGLEFGLWAILCFPV